MGLIGDDQARRGDVQAPGAGVGADEDAIRVRPGGDSRLLVLPVRDKDGQVGEPSAFAYPVDDHGGRDHHEGAEVVLCGGQVRGHGDRLDGFTQAHVIAEQDLLLHHGEAGPEGLVPTQVQVAQVCGVQFQFADALQDGGVQVFIHALDLTSQQRGEQTLVVGGAGQIVVPDIGRGWCDVLGMEEVGVGAHPGQVIGDAVPGRVSLVRSGADDDPPGCVGCRDGGELLDVVDHTVAAFTLRG